MDETNMKHTGAYVVIHHGPDGKQTAPLFLVNPCFNNAKPHTYTAAVGRAFLYAYYSAAKDAAAKENEYLKQQGHPLAGRIEVGELFVRDYEPKEDK